MDQLFVQKIKKHIQAFLSRVGSNGYALPEQRSTTAAKCHSYIGSRRFSRSVYLTAHNSYFDGFDSLPDPFFLVRFQPFFHLTGKRDQVYLSPSTGRAGYEIDATSSKACRL